MSDGSVMQSPCLLGPLMRVTLLLDEPTVTQFKALGKNASDEGRRAARVAYERYQRTPDAPTETTR